MSQDDLNSSACAIFEVALPMDVSHAWVAFACQKAALARPRWHVERRVWTTRGVGAFGDVETMTIATPGGPRTLQVRAEWAADAATPEPLRRETATARRFVSALVTGMLQRTRSVQQQRR